MIKIGLALLITGVSLWVLVTASTPVPDSGRAWAQAAQAAITPPGPPSTNGQIDFGREIKPVLQAACAKCHGSENTQARLRLDSEAGILKGGVSGAAIVPGHSADSLLVKRLLGATDAPRMPLGGDPLPANQINLIRAWIDYGSFPTPQSATALSSGRAGEAGSSPPSAPPNDSGRVMEASQNTPGPGGARPPAASPVFATEIRPILAARCYRCHGPDIQQNGLRLDSLQALLAGSETGRVRARRAVSCGGCSPSTGPRCHTAVRRFLRLKLI